METLRNRWRTPPMEVALSVAFLVWAASAAPPPNVVVVLTNDQGLGDFSCTGNPVLRTPNLDRQLRTVDARRGWPSAPAPLTSQP